MSHKPKHHHFRLADLPMDRKLSRKDYDEKLAGLHRKLQAIQQAYLVSGDRAIVVFEGWDAGGKGGAIRRMTSVMDPRSCHVWPIGAPTDREQGKHYLFRFWQRLPDPSSIAIFDRSWYGRVMVERVEGLASREEWTRAYHEIAEFERMLIDDGVRIVKLFLHITPEEQLERFRKRLEDPLKRWKLSYEDLRNRQKWDDYVGAIEEMIDRTSTAAAPWTAIPANDKDYARIAAIETVVETLSRGVDLSPRPISPDLARVAREALGLDLPVEKEDEPGKAMGQGRG